MTIKDIKLSVDNQKVAAKLYSPDSIAKTTALLFLHGWTGRPNETAAEFMAQNGFHCLTIIMRGHEGSDGDIKKIRTQDSLDDAIAAYDFLKANIPHGSKIVAVGNSYGGYISSLLSGERPLAGLSLRVPAAYPDTILSLPKWGRGHEDMEVNSWRHESIEWKDNAGFKAIHNFHGPIQIIEAGRDEFVPHQVIQNYLNAVSNPHQVEHILMRDWPHSIGQNEEISREFKQLLLNWLTKVESGL